VVIEKTYTLKSGKDIKLTISAEVPPQSMSIEERNSILSESAATMRGFHLRVFARELNNML
jgi:hypothetical protein